MAQKKKQRPKKARVERKVWMILASVLILAIVCGSAFEIYKLNQNPIRTTTAKEETVRSTLQADAFIFRNEQSIEADFSGYTVPFVQDGEHVEHDAQIAARFTDAGSAQRYTELLELRMEYERVLALSTAADYSSMRLETLMDKAKRSVFDFLQSADSGNMIETTHHEQEYLSRETMLDVAVNGNVNFAEKLSSLDAKIKAQEASLGSFTTVTTGMKEGGYFFSETDGYEDVVSYSDANKLTVSEVEQALDALPVQSSGCKIIKDFNWYIATVVEKNTANLLSKRIGKQMKVRFPQSGVREVEAMVYSVQQEPSGKAAVVFRCLEADEGLLHLRKAKIEITTSEHTGLKIPTTALRVINLKVPDKYNSDGTPLEKSAKGVFVLRGNMITFRVVNPIYSCDEFVLAVDDGKGNEFDRSFVKLYDEVIIEGKDLQDGAVIYQ